MTGQAGNLYCYVKDRIKPGTFAFVRPFAQLGLDKACPQLNGSVPGWIARLQLSEHSPVRMGGIPNRP